MSLHAISVFDKLRYKNEALNNLHLKSTIIKYFKEVIIDKWPDCKFLLQKLNCEI